MTAHTEPRNGSYGRALALVSGASMLVPVVGLATAPIIAHAVGVVGRGELTAALAPNLVIVAGATLGLPPALTYVLARRPAITRRALAWACLLALALGLVLLAVVAWFRFALVPGDPGLAALVLLGTWFALPTLVVGLLRGAAYGRHLWTAVAVERVASAVLRLVGLAVLAVLGRLDVVTGVLVLGLAPVLAGVAYVGLLRRPEGPDDDAVPADPADGGAAPAPHIARQLLAFGSQEWLGSVAVMLIARTSQLLVTPLAGVAQLGLLVAAITVSDVPYIVTQAIREVVFGVSSAEADVDRLTATSRVCTAVAAAGSLVIGVTLPLWITTFFGAGFAGAVVPAWLLLVSSVVAVPGLIAGAGMDAAGRPGKRTVALLTSLAVNVVGLVALTPSFGATGAAGAALLSTLVSTVLMLHSSSALLATRPGDYVLARAADLVLVRALVRRVAGRFVHRGGDRADG